MSTNILRETVLAAIRDLTERVNTRFAVSDNMYDSVADGMAGTTPGQRFSAPDSGVDPAWIIIYENVDGVLWTEIYRYPTAKTIHDAIAAAEAAQLNAEIAQSLAEVAQAAAEDAQAAAEGVQSGAIEARTGAEAAKADTQALLDTFEALFLGTKPADPTTDNDGLALLTGSVYYNSNTSEAMFYTGSSWVAPGTVALDSAAAAEASAASVAADAEAANVAKLAAEAAQADAEGALSAVQSEATAAATSAANAATSATDSASSATASATARDASAAARDASAAAQAASEGARDASIAAKDAAVVAEGNTAAIFDAFDDIFLGTKADDPTVDNDGNPLLIGSMYYNSTHLDTRFWNGTVWEVAGVYVERAEQAAADSDASALASASSATDSANSATESANFATTSAGHATDSANYATESSDYATASAAARDASATAQAASEVARDGSIAAKNAAEIAEANAAAIYDAIDDLFLGTKPEDPTVDNDGNPLLIGAMYYNSTYLDTRFWNGTVWEVAGVYLARADQAAADSEASALASASSATDSAASATDSSNFATASAGSATESATNATNSANSATASATARDASIAARDASATARNESVAAKNAAEIAESNAAAVYDAFDDRYLGSKVEDPTVDNDGNPLQVGAMYFNSTSLDTRFWNGTFWDVAGAYSGRAELAADDAEASALDSATSATDSATSATASATSATESANSATASATARDASAAARDASAAAQAASETARDESVVAKDAALVAEANTTALYDEFGDLFLGTKATNPTTDNDGNPIRVGAIYYNSEFLDTRFWNGSSWDVAGVYVSRAEKAATDSEASALAASISETNAATSEMYAAESLALFNSTYLGEKPADPTTDGNGAALNGGELYFNSTSGTLRIYSGGVWTTGAFDVGASMLGTNNLSELTDTAVARANLGLAEVPMIDDVVALTIALGG